MKNNRVYRYARILLLFVTVLTLTVTFIPFASLPAEAAGTPVNDSPLKEGVYQQTFKIESYSYNGIIR